MIEGLTVKQEMRAIKEAIGKRDRKFLGKYGGADSGRGEVQGTP